MDASTHPFQLTVIGAAIALDIIVLAYLNAAKRRGSSNTLSWPARRNRYWILIAALTSLATWLDAHYAITPTALAVKAYAFAFPLGLLDLHFSSTTGVPLKVVAGASLWCSCIVLRDQLTAHLHGAPIPPVMVTTLSARTVLVEAVRYVMMLPVVGLLSDLIFSPMHRLAHHPRLYKGHHKEHHEYTNQLTALVLYHGALLDDFLMPVTTTVGGALYILLLSLVGLQGEAFSNVSGYLVIFNTLLSHAHDIRCARLMAPLPDSLNFVAYHYEHHLSPSNNYGLTEPSDVIWDRILGVSTVRKPGFTAKPKVL